VMLVTVFGGSSAKCLDFQGLAWGQSIWVEITPARSDNFPAIVWGSLRIGENGKLIEMIESAALELGSNFKKG
jgi:hypothetical protein